MKINEIESSDLEDLLLPNDEHIPTLEEVLNLLKGKLCINIEFKTDDYETVYLTLKMVKEKNMLNQIETSSFLFKVKEHILKATEELELPNKINFGFLIWLDEWEEPELGYENKGDSMNLDSRMITERNE
mmetsp:Transcript_33128/g.30042  ORF Transcript_33128/g.30042 Transcript_33128/m.30042 type:complete len:130 (+) Transcript_33128:346-735(+)